LYERERNDNEIVEKARELEDNGNLNDCIKYIDENINSLQDQSSKSDILKIKSECFLYQEMPNSEMAKQFAEEALKISLEKNDLKRVAEANLLLSQITVLEDGKKAVEYGRKALEIYQKLNDKGEYIYSMISLATILEDFKEASSLSKSTSRCGILKQHRHDGAGSCQLCVSSRRREGRRGTTQNAR